MSTLRITPTSVNPFRATVSTDGLASPIELSFAPRSGSTTSIISTLPTALRALGTATNVTIKLADFVVGKTIERVSVAGAKSAPHSKRPVTPDPIQYGVDPDGRFSIWQTAPDGTHLTRFSSDDSDLAYACAVAVSFASWLQAATDVAVGYGKKYDDEIARVRASLKALNADDATIEKLLDGIAKPDYPDFKLTKRPARK